MKQLHSPFVFQHDSYFFLILIFLPSEKLFSQGCGMWNVEWTSEMLQRLGLWLGSAPCLYIDYLNSESQFSLSRMVGWNAMTGLVSFCFLTSLNFLCLWLWTKWTEFYTWKVTNQHENGLDYCVSALPSSGYDRTSFDLAGNWLSFIQDPFAAEFQIFLSIASDCFW